MKSFFTNFFALLLCFSLGHLSAQDTLSSKITTILDLSQASSKLPVIIDNAGNNRGASFNGEHVFVASRQGGNNIFFWNPKNATAEPGKLNMTGVTGGTFTVSDVATSGKHIIMSNMAFANGNFKVYHWADTTAEPKVLLNIPAAPARVGDAITVIGDPGTKAQLFVSGHGTKNFYIWDIVAGKIDSINPKVVTLDSLPNVNFARINKVPQEDMYLLSGADARLALLDKNFKQIDRAAGEFVLSWPMHAQVFYYAGKRYMSYVHIRTSPAENELQVIDITRGKDITEAFKLMRDSSITKLFVHKANLGNVSNGNASVGHNVLTDSDGKIWLMAYSAGNGLKLQNLAKEEAFTVVPLTPITTILDFTKASDKLPAIIDNAGNNRGASFNGEHVFVASRQGGNNVFFWDPKNAAAEPGKLNMTGVTGGTFTVSDVATSGKHIIMSNMAFVNGNFKVYHWSDTKAEPKVLLNIPAAPARVGDAITVVGDPGTKAQLFVSGHGTKNFYIWDIVAGKIDSINPKVVTLDSLPTVNFGRINKVPQEDMYLLSGPDARLVLLDNNFKQVDRAAGEFVLSWPMHAQVFYNAGRRYMSYVHIRTSPAENELQVIDITRGKDITTAFKLMRDSSITKLFAHKANLGNVSNGNASVGHNVIIDSEGKTWLMAYSAGNGLVLQRVAKDEALAVVPLTPISTILDFTKASDKLPAIIDNAGNNRGASFNGEHVFVASRQGGNNVFFWDPKNAAAEPGKLNMTGVTGGTFTVSDVATSGKHIIMSNMAFLNGNFKVYHWSDTKAEPKVLLNIPAAPARVGDAITVIGDPGTKAQLFVSGHGTKNFYIWDIVAGKIDSINPKVVTLDSLPTVNFGRINKVPQEDMYLLSGPDARLALLDKNFKQIDRAAGEFVLSWPMHAQVFYNEGRRYMSYVHIRTSPAENELQVIDITRGKDITEAFKLMRDSSITKLFAHKANLGNVSNGNASVGHSVITDSEGKIWLMAYSAGNGLILQRVADQTTNIDKVALKEFTMYPNPAATDVRINSEYLVEKVLIFDLNGQNIQNHEVNDREFSLNINNLRNGIYLVALKSNEGTQIQKLVVQK